MKIIAGILMTLVVFTQYSCADSKGNTTKTFKVWGNCDMCKETIEGSLKVDGISSADWDTETKEMEVSYDSTKINFDEIQQKIAAVGYDTEKYKGDDKAYDDLHKCCKYERKK
ncbi:MAG TPA: heavy-metal-associated domain-containing protein [Flavobacteriales bacterium]|nr:heavy-metal-associated domain-containing protein [Flavobacteriales bacterium]